MSDFVISKEVADEEFDRWLECNYLEDNWDDLESDGKRDALRDKSRIIRAIMHGAAVIDEAGLLTYTPQRSKDQSPISFKEPSGFTLAVTDKLTEQQLVGKMNAALCDFTSKPKKYFHGMNLNPDYNTCLSIITIFLA